MAERGAGRIGGVVLVALIGLILVRAVFGAIWGLISLFVFAFYALAILDVVTSRRSVAAKLLWTIGILAFPIAGAAVYWFAGRDATHQIRARRQ